MTWAALGDDILTACWKSITSNVSFTPESPRYTLGMVTSSILAQAMRGPPLSFTWMTNGRPSTACHKREREKEKESNHSQLP